MEQGSKTVRHPPNHAFVFPDASDMPIVPRGIHEGLRAAGRQAHALPARADAFKGMSLEQTFHAHFRRLQRLISRLGTTRGTEHTVRPAVCKYGLRSLPSVDGRRADAGVRRVRSRLPHVLPEPTA